MLQCDFQFQRDQFDLHVQFHMCSQIMGIVGASGSGKTTLLQNIVGLVQPMHGTIQLNQNLLYDAKQQIYVPMHQRKIALIFQKASVFPHMNVQQNLIYAEKLLKQADEKKFNFNQVVELLELRPLLKRKAYQLSGGEAQRVSIGRALLSSPQLLLLDEPLTGLDKRLKDQILPFLKQLKDETQLPMLYVTHHHDELEYLDADFYKLEDGVMNRPYR